MGNALWLEIFLAFSQPCHMDYSQVRYSLSYKFHCPSSTVFRQSMMIPFTEQLNDAVLLKKFCGEEGERVDVQKLFGYIGLFTLVALWWLGKNHFNY